jgi:hypothetical protein
MLILEIVLPIAVAILLIVVYIVYKKRKQQKDLRIFQETEPAKSGRIIKGTNDTKDYNQIGSESNSVRFDIKPALETSEKDPFSFFRMRKIRSKVLDNNNSNLGETLDDLNTPTAKSFIPASFDAEAGIGKNKIEISEPTQFEYRSIGSMKFPDDLTPSNKILGKGESVFDLERTDLALKKEPLEVSEPTNKDYRTISSIKFE